LTNLPFINNPPHIYTFVYNNIDFTHEAAQMPFRSGPFYSRVLTRHFCIFLWWLKKIRLSKCLFHLFERSSCVEESFKGTCNKALATFVSSLASSHNPFLLAASTGGSGLNLPMPLFCCLHWEGASSEVGVVMS